jgi:hypothetical protein
MKLALIRYKTKPEATEKNRQLIANVFAELHETSPEGARYATLTSGDGVFFHLVERTDTDNPLLKLEAFKIFQSGVRERCVELPQVSEVIIVGNYRMLGER